MSESGSGDWHMVLGAKVQWPADMPDNMLEFVIESAKATIGAVDNWYEGTDADDAVAALRQKLEDEYDPYWHVFAGRSFGTEATHESRRYAFFYLGDRAVLVYKTS